MNFCQGVKRNGKYPELTDRKQSPGQHPRLEAELRTRVEFEKHNLTIFGSRTYRYRVQNGVNNVQDREKPR